MAMGLGSPGGRGRRKAPMAEINVTPLVDVMLVLLIIFMVTAPLLVAGVPVDLPDAKAGALGQEEEPVQLSIDNSRKVFLDTDEVPLEALPGRLAALSGKGGEKGPRVFLRADRSLDYGLVMRVLGELDHAGLKRVALISTGGDAPAKER